MNLTQDRVRSIGWAFVLTVCVALVLGLMLRVDAVKGQVQEVESKIVSVKSEIRFLEIEFQARANQQQLSALNDIEFGYTAPGPGQFLEGERQLTALGVPRGPDAPAPIRMARKVEEREETALLAMVSPLTGRASDAPETASAAPKDDQDGTQDDAFADLIGEAIKDKAASGPATHLARIELSRGAGE